MRLHRVVPMLASVATLAAVSAPAASAQQPISPSGGVPQTGTTLAAHHSSGSSDWLIGVGAAGGVVLVSAGLAGTRRAHRRTATAQRIRAASGL